MADAGAWNQGWALGAERAQESRLHKQALKDKEFLEQHDNLVKQRDTIEANLPSLKGTPDYDKAVGALTSAEKAIREHWHPAKNPGMIQTYGHKLLEAMRVAKPVSTQTMVVPNPKGLIQAGNINIWTRPTVQNLDGSHSSEYSTSFRDENGYEVLVPTVVDGKFLTPDSKKPPEGSDAEKAMFKAAWDHYKKTGENLGKFATSQDADRYAQILHARGTAPKNIVKEERQQAQAQTADRQATQRDIAGAPLSPEQQSQIKAKAAATEVKMALDNANQLWDQENPNATDEEKRDAHYQNFQRLVLDDRYSQSRAAKPDIQSLILSDGTESPAQWDVARRTWTYLSGDIIPANLLNGAKIKAKATGSSSYVKGTMVKSKQSPTGFAQLYLDKTDPNKIVGWQPVTASRYYQGSTSSDVSTDAFGVKTTSQRQTQPMNQQEVDLSKLIQVPESAEDVPLPQGAAPAPVVPSNAVFPQPISSGAPKKAPQAATPSIKPEVPSAAAGKLIPNPAGGLPLDENMHIPEWTEDNPLVKEAANQLLDGVDIKDLGIPGKDAKAVEQLARKYGWGRGAYLPRELKQIQNADQFLDLVLASKPFMKALDSGFFQKWKMSEAEADPTKESVWGRGFHTMAVQNLSPDQQEYVRLRQAMLGTVSGLSSVVRTGRPTEATIHRLAMEIPDVLSSASSKDAKARVENIKREIAVALKQGVPKPSLTGHLDNKGQPEKPATVSPDAVKSLREKLLQAQ